jgi:hypothetical protein
VSCHSPAGLARREEDASRLCDSSHLRLSFVDSSAMRMPAAFGERGLVTQLITTTAPLEVTCNVVASFVGSLSGSRLPIGRLYAMDACRRSRADA